MENYTKADLEEAQKALASLIRKCEKAQENLSQGTGAWTTLCKRLKAFRLASQMITEALAQKRF